MVSASGEEAAGRWPPLVLEPTSVAGSAARRYVREILGQLGRDDLVDALSLAVTELVTNAALHARTSLTVRVLPSLRAGARIEVADGSPVFPRRRRYSATTTVGRGLRLLDALGRWDVRARTGDGPPGKVIGFELADVASPASSCADPGAVCADPTNVCADSADVCADPAVPCTDPVGAPTGEPVTVRMLRFPLQLFAAAREHHDELIREFTLLALAPADPAARPVPDRLTELVEVLGGRYRAVSERIDAVRDKAVSRGQLAIDLTYRVPPSTAETMAAMDELMDEADRFSRSEELLTLAVHPVLRSFRRWFSAEFVRQTAGHPPTPWTGPLDAPIAHR